MAGLAGLPRHWGACRASTSFEVPATQAALAATWHLADPEMKSWQERVSHSSALQCVLIPFQGLVAEASARALRGVVTAARCRGFLKCMCKALSSAVQQHDLVAVRHVLYACKLASVSSSGLRCTGIACRTSCGRNDMHMPAMEASRVCACLFAGHCWTVEGSL